MAVSSFIPTIWDARLLYNLEKAHVATKLVNRDYEGEIKNAGDKVKINTIGAITIGDYVAGTTSISPETLSTEAQTLEITECKYFAFKVEDIDATQAKGDLIDSAMGRAAYGLNDTADAFLLTKLASGVDSGNVVGTDAAPISLTSANVFANIVALRTKLDKANVPTQGRAIVVNPDTYALLLQDTTHFAVANNATTGDNAIVNGLVGRIAGFDVYQSNNVLNVSADSGVAAHFEIVACVPTACTYAEQIIKTEAYRPEGSFSDAVKGLHVYGAKVTDGKQIAVLKATV